MLRHLAIAVLALIGDLSISRVQLCVLAAFAVLALTYWLALPTELPLWPAGVVITIALVGGLAWESRKDRQSADDTHAR